MLRSSILFLLLLSTNVTFAKDQLPTIGATSATIDIRVGDDYFLKGGWRLEPHKNPDVFTLGSKWPYDFKTVTFITDIDSISFNVQPGHSYDFIIMLHSTTTCHLRIVSRANPVFMDTWITIPILMFLLIVVCTVGMKTNLIMASHLLYLGYVTPLLFWITTLVAGDMHGNYNHLQNTISELGALETRAEIFVSTSFLFLGLLGGLFSLAFYKISKALSISVIPAILSLSKPVAMAWAAIFPLGNEFHRLTGPLPLLIVLGSLLSFLFWKKGSEFRSVRLFSLVGFLIMLLLLTRFIRPFGQEYEGLVQRFFYFGWTVWSVGVTFFLSTSVKPLMSGK